MVAPLIVLSAFFVYLVRLALLSRGIQVNDSLYNFACVVVVCGTSAIAMEPVLRELRRRKKEENGGGDVPPL